MMGPGCCPPGPPSPYNCPTLAGFQAFIANVMAIPPAALPSDDPVIAMAFGVAMQIVSTQLVAAGIYALAVYNLAGDNLINYAMDQPGQTYFQDVRTKFNANGFVPGIISATSDESTSNSYLNSEAAKTFTLGNLQNLKTPWGQRYLSFAQDIGTLWGLS